MVSQEPYHRLLEADRRKAHIKLLLEEITQGEVPAGGVTLELGCGHGHWLTAYAQENPERLCLGVDLITRRIERANRKKDKRGLPHLHFFKAEAMELLQAMNDSIQIDVTILLFPDPWPKKRHHKRRLINKCFLDLLAKRSRKGGQLFFRTDHEGYFTWAREALENNASWEWTPDQPWPLEHETIFQNLLPHHQSLAARIT